MLNKDIKDKTEKRINIIKGQLNGLLRMIHEDEYCIDILDQSFAIQNSIKSVDNIILENHLRTHVAKQFPKQKEKSIKELVKLFKKGQRNK